VNYLFFCFQDACIEGRQKKQRKEGCTEKEGNQKAGSGKGEKRCVFSRNKHHGAI